MGIFVRTLGEYGFSSIQIVSIRVTLAALIFAMILLIKDRSGFKIRLKDIPTALKIVSSESLLSLSNVNKEPNNKPTGNALLKINGS